jgi:hypothetical protein
MDFTFGIITCKNSNNYIPKIIESIKKLKIPNYEILIVGESNVNDDYDVINLPFDETIKPAWITKKKNIITENAKYENIVYMHDYHIFNSDWYEGYLKYGNDFKVCSNIILNSDGHRYRDWIWYHCDEIPLGRIPNREHLLPYSEDRCSKWMYINGSYWVAKKEIMQEFPLDEKLAHCESEDIVWSKQVSSKYNFSFNPYSSVFMVKYHSHHWNVMSSNVYQNYIIPFLKKHDIA